MDSRIVVAVGDIHGCIEEFDELLKTIQYDKSQMRLVLLGDLMDRGPDPVGCVRRARELGVECIMGNHEEKHIRWHKHAKKQDETGKPNPMKPMASAEQKANVALNDQDWTWLKARPLKLDLGLNWWAVHAGCEPRYSLEQQNPSQIMRVRFVDERGAAQALDNHKQPANTVYWTEQWLGPDSHHKESLIYGHCVHSLKNPREDYSGEVDPITCLGIDTGCCFGGRLTACFLKKGSGNYYMHEYVQVQAKKVYYEGFAQE